jgi:hypothetical protein
MMKRSWIFILPLVLGFLMLSGAPSQAAGPLWKVTNVKTVGCNSDAWSLDINFAGIDSDGGYIAHTVVSSGGKVYMNQNSGGLANGHGTWGLFSDTTYGPTTGTYPIPVGHPMTAVFTLERPLGNVLSSWTMVARSCSTKTLLFNGPTADDGDGDYISVYRDKCPELRGLTSNGCPIGGRSLTLNAIAHPRAVVGKLVSSPGFSGLSVHRIVTIWKVRPGADKKVATRTTNSAGAFSAFVKPGRYYAKSAGVIIATVGQTSADTSRIVKVN